MPKGGGRNTIGIKYDVDGSRRPEREREKSISLRGFPIGLVKFYVMCELRKGQNILTSNPLIPHMMEHLEV